MFEENRLIALLLLLAAAAPAYAGIVSIKIGDKFGQGWMFLDTDSHCKVLTPAHVVLTAEGQIARGITISDPHLGSVTAATPIILSPVNDLDVAVLPLRGADNPSLCGPSRVENIGIQRRILNMGNARIERIEDLATVASPVRLRMRSSFDDRFPRSSRNEEGSTFTVLNANDRVVGGWSGSAVLDEDDTFLGMITDADKFGEPNAGLAVAATTIRYLLDYSRGTAVRTPSSSLRQPAIRVLAGTTGATGNQDLLFSPTRPGWQVTPINRKVVFTLLFQSTTHFHGITLQPAGASNTVTSVELASPDESSENAWLSLNYCPVDNTQGAVTCTSIGTSVRLLRVTLTFKQTDPIQLYGLTIFP